MTELNKSTRVEIGQKARTTKASLFIKQLKKF